MSRVIEEFLTLVCDGFWDEAIDLLTTNPVLATTEVEGCSLLSRIVWFDGAAELTRRMLDLGADPNHQNDDGSTALGNAIRSGHRLGIGTDEIIRLLVSAGADLKLFDEAGIPPIQAAIWEHRPGIVEFLLKSGADPFQKNSYGDDAFEYMAFNRDQSMRPALENGMSKGPALNVTPNTDDD